MFANSLFYRPTSIAQVDDFTIDGESLSRNQGYGVENHYFQIENYVIPELDSWFVPTDPETDDCPYEVYTTDYMPLYTDDYDDSANTLKIRPYSINNASDYRNGVSSLDLLAIQAQFLDNPSFENRSPTEDFPYRYISGDADYDGDVDTDDLDMIHDLILFYRDDLTRNSWEWVHKEEVEDAEERFEDEPYDFVIDDYWPGSEGIILPALTTNEIIADNDKFFAFRTTKIGDITANSTLLAASYNSWVCGSGSYFSGEKIVVRSSRVNSDKRIRSGSTLTVAIMIENTEEVYALEIPIYFSNQDYEFLGITFSDQYSPRWHRNDSYGSFVISDFSKDLNPIEVPRGVLAEFVIKARHDIGSIEKSIHWYPERSIELVSDEELILIPEVFLQIQEILPSDLFAEVWSGASESQLMIESPFDQTIQLSIFNGQGQNIHRDVIRVGKGQNLNTLADLVPGFYVCA